MSQINTTGAKAFITAVAALTRYQRVALNGSGQLVVAGEDELSIGFVEGFVGAGADVAVGDSITVRLLTSAGTFKAIVNEAVAAGASLYGAADGEVQDTDPGSGTIRFLALEAGSADGSVIEILPLVLN